MAGLAALFFAAALGAIFYVPSLFQQSFPVHHSGVVVITGASSGIGRDAALYLAEKTGFTIFAGVRNQRDFDAVIAQKKPSLKPLMIDVSKHESCVSAVGVLTDYLNANNMELVGLVNNAGISRRGLAEFHDISDARVVFDTNFFGVMDLVQLTLPLLRQGKGRIVMLSSLSGVVGSPTSSVYVASKFALEGFSDSLRREIGIFNISVSIVEPGYVQTSIFDKSPENVANAPHNNAAPDHIKSLYPRLTSKEVDDNRAKSLAKADTTKVTNEAIFDALTAEKPKTRYPVANAGGIPAAAVAWLGNHMPDAIVDAIMRAM